jgi:hypothetical protein
MADTVPTKAEAAPTALSDLSFVISYLVKSSSGVYSNYKERGEGKDVASSSRDKKF